KFDGQENDNGELRPGYPSYRRDCGRRYCLGDRSGYGRREGVQSTCAGRSEYEEHRPERTRHSKSMGVRQEAGHGIRPEKLI
ncbi:hypothetical protein LTR40_013546, partial [Exophiala xenobiotica]